MKIKKYPLACVVLMCYASYIKLVSCMSHSNPEAVIFEVLHVPVCVVPEQGAGLEALLCPAPRSGRTEWSLYPPPPLRHLCVVVVSFLQFVQHFQPHGAPLWPHQVVVEGVIVHPELHGDVLLLTFVCFFSRGLVGFGLDPQCQVHGVPCEVCPEGGAAPPVSMTTVPVIVCHDEVNRL